ncbi:uncharacterized RING finger protein ECU07_0330-like [Dendronephthya gigantea]|uniref:uncharacterized RING finger protein ECU07_0330-like n=1 Tax=Dendronephthya gigantea TaxID=151771 RepID=UPI00106C3F0C|nr:uncharacterized RING finger protein ECU07_0330-like [Dendronephthya gigantea]
MAVDSLATSAAKVLERTKVYEVYNSKISTIPTASGKHSTKNQMKETTTSTNDALKKAKLRRERNEVVKHLYNVMDTVRQTNYSDSAMPSDSESLGEIDSEFLDRYDHDLKYHRRKLTNSRLTKRERLPSSKEKRFVDFCRECETTKNIKLERGTRKAIKVKCDKCTKQISRNNNCREQNLERKANIEKKLRKLGLKRLEEIKGKNTRTTSENRDHPATEKFALRDENAPREMQDMVSFLLSLQFRDVTPEDYEFLLRLDESIPTKTVPEKRLASLTEDETSEEHANELCSVCIESYELGQTRKTLPCGHVFHSNCIETWLRKSSTKCPLDGWEI